MRAEASSASEMQAIKGREKQVIDETFVQHSTCLNFKTVENHGGVSVGDSSVQ